MQFVAVFAMADNTSEKYVITGTTDSDKRVKEEMWTKQCFWKHIHMLVWSGMKKTDIYLSSGEEKKKKKKEVWCSLWFVLVTKLWPQFVLATYWVAVYLSVYQ